MTYKGPGVKRNYAWPLMVDSMVDLHANRQGTVHAYYKGPGQGDASLCGRGTHDGTSRTLSDTRMCRSCESILINIGPTWTPGDNPPKQPKKAVPVANDTPRWWYQPYEHPKHKVLDHAHVWCDEHCEIHPARPDSYQEGNEACCPTNWRPVYIGSDDPTEDFG